MSIKKKIIPLFLCVICLFIITPSYAETEFKDDEYNQFVTDVVLKATKHDPAMYKKLRELYRQTSFYDPNIPPAEIKDHLATYSDDMTEEEKSIFFKELFTIIHRHAGDLSVQMAVTTFYRKLGKEEHYKSYKEISNQIADVAFNSGDGLTPETAFKAINKTEQHFILNYILKKRYNVKRLENINYRLFDVYEAYDRNITYQPNTKTQDIYFDITEQFGKGEAFREIEETSKEPQQTPPATEQKRPTPE